MELTKYNHATVVLEEGDTTIVIDPGTFTPEAADLATAATGVLITHEHFDHFDADALRAALDANVDLVVRAPQAVVDQLGEHDGRVQAVAAGDAFTIGALPVRVFGEEHAVIHPDLPTIANVGYLVDDAVFHPGDAYLVPGVPVRLLLVPTSGPWAKTGEGIDYVRAVAPERAVQIHELLLSEVGQQANVRMFGTDGLGGVPTSVLPVGERTTV